MASNRRRPPQRKQRKLFEVKGPRVRGPHRVGRTVKSGTIEGPSIRFFHKKRR